MQNVVQASPCLFLLLARLPSLSNLFICLAPPQETKSNFRHVCEETQWQLKNYSLQNGSNKMCWRSTIAHLLRCFNFSILEAREFY